ncbi:DUF4129 domain-containing protein [Evansella sp. AB-rgal1]|uniref:DUF4129 domain-containing protein n=1 Tax=Evansella sp. AB-rgal1 TaxID=3242696 RepID=UPI00359D7711
MSDQGRHRLEEILNGSEYQVYYDESQGFIETLFIRIRDWFIDVLSELFPSLAVSNGVSGTVLILVIILILVVLAVVLVKVGLNVKRNRTFRENKPLQNMDEMKWSYQKHMEEAKKQENMKEYTLATRHMFLALLLYFHEINWLEAKIWKTNWEYYEELRQVDKTGAELFFQYALLFDQVTYGERIVEKEEYMKYRIEAMKWLNNQHQIVDK